MNIILKDINQWGEQETQCYTNQLDRIVEMVVCDAKESRYYEINILTDLLKLKQMNNCDAGEGSFTLAPNGKIYICPAFYFDNPENSIGSLDDGINIQNEYLLSLEYAPICSACDAYQCNRCKYLNFKNTGEINTPSSMQCIVSHIERNASRKLQLRLQEENMAAYMEILPEINYKDPFEKIANTGR